MRTRGNETSTGGHKGKRCARGRRDAAVIESVAKISQRLVSDRREDERACELNQEPQGTRRHELLTPKDQAVRRSHEIRLAVARHVDSLAAQPGTAARDTAFGLVELINDAERGFAELVEEARHEARQLRWQAARNQCRVGQASCRSRVWMAWLPAGR